MFAMTLRWIGIFLAACGVLSLLAWSVASVLARQETPQPAHQEALVQEYLSEFPVHITLERLHIDADVVPGTYDAAQDSWNVSFDHAQFATITTQLNAERGATLVYAHNTSHLFGPLKHVEEGDRVRVRAASGALYEYVYAGETIVDPSDTALFEGIHEGSPRLILLTCAGSWNQHRRVLSFAFDRIL